MMVKNKNEILGVTAISIAAAAWGFDGVVLTPTLYNLDVGFVVFMIHLIPFLFMNVIFFKEYKNLTKFSKSDYVTIALIAFFGGAVGTLSIVKALFLVNFQSLSIVVLLQKLQPIFAIFLAAILLKERIKGNFVIWASLAIGASYFLSFGWGAPKINGDPNTLYAVLFALLAALSFGSATVFGKKLMLNHSFTTATFFRYGFTALIMMIYVLFMGKMGQFENITPANWQSFLIIALTTGSGAILLFYFGLMRVKAMVSTLCELFFPISAIGFDYLFNDKLLSPIQWISAIIMITAILRISANQQQD